jgi:hypothetical protein
MPRGQTAHLEGRRTGRPLGTGHRSTVLQDLRWAHKTLGDPAARPPTEGAKRCKDLAERDFPKFVLLLGKLEAMENGEARLHGAAGHSPSGNSPSGSGQTTAKFSEDGQSRRLRKVRMRESTLLSTLRNGLGNWVYLVPSDAQVLRLELDASERTIDLVMRSASFPEVANGNPIPGLENRHISQGPYQG